MYWGQGYRGDPDLLVPLHVPLHVPLGSRVLQDQLILGFPIKIKILFADISTQSMLKNTVEVRLQGILFRHLPLQHHSKFTKMKEIKSANKI